MPKPNHIRRSELLVRCIPMLRSYIRRRVSNREGAHDALQEVILTILSAPHCPDDTAEFADFCRDIASQAVSREALPADSESRRPASRREDEEEEMDDFLEPSDPFGDPERAADTREELFRAVHKLNDDALKLLVRRYVLEENANEIARELAQTPAALRVRLMRLRSAARGALSRVLR